MTQVTPIRDLKGYLLPEQVKKLIAVAKTQGTKVGGVTPLGAILDGVATFTVAGEKIELFAENLFRCYDEYRDMRDLIDWQSDFSSTIREGAKNEKRHTWERIH